jgi:hydroxymethylglutaryl-CoA lyase
MRSPPPFFILLCGGSIEESLARFGEVVEAAKGRNVRVRGYVSCVLGTTHRPS